MFRSYMSIHFWYNCGCFSSVFTRLHPLHLQSDIPVWCGSPQDECQIDAQATHEQARLTQAEASILPWESQATSSFWWNHRRYWAQEGLPVKDGLKAVSTTGWNPIASPIVGQHSSSVDVSCSTSLHPLLLAIGPEGSLSSSSEFGVHSCAFLLFIVWEVVF